MSFLSQSQLTAPFRPALRLIREARVLPAAMRASGPRRLVALPAKPATDGAARLRVYDICQGLRGLGWTCLVLPPALTLVQRRRMVRLFGPDAILMQGARHPLNRPALYPGIPILYDMDDADFHLPHLSDLVREAMPRVSMVIAGSRYIADWALSHGAAHARVVWTGTSPGPGDPPPHTGRGLTVAWAQTRPMTYGSEALFVARVMAGVARQVPGVTLRLYDRRWDDPADFAAGFAAPGLTVDWRPPLGYGDYLKSFDDVAVGLAPLLPDAPFVQGKSFGKVLGYLDRGVPVVCSAAGEHPQFFDGDTAVMSDDESIWVRALVRLLNDPSERDRMARVARARFLKSLTTEVAAEQVSETLDAVLRDKPRAVPGD